MTDVNMFVDKYAYLQISSDFEEIKKTYYENDKNLSKYLEQRNQILENMDFDFKRKLDLYNFLKYCVAIDLNLAFYDLTEKYMDISHTQYISIPLKSNDYFLYYANLLLYLNITDVYNLKKEDFTRLLNKFEKEFPKVSNFLDLCQKVQDCINIEDKILYSIYFDEDDILVNIDGKLINLIKNEEYELTEEDTKFLTWCAKEKNLLIEGVTREEVSFIKECIEAFNNEMEQHRPRLSYEDSYDAWNEFYMDYMQPGSLHYYINSALEEKGKIKKLEINKQN